MQAVVLGAAAGGGFPQWNSNAAGCRRARAGDPLALPRTQASIAVSGDGEHWYLLNASPDLREQIGATTVLHPRGETRSTPIAGIILTGGDIDVIAGLLTLRERQAFTLYATSRIHAVLDANSIFEVLARDVVPRVTLKLDEPVALAGGLTVELFAVPGKVPLYLEQGDAMPAIAIDETTVAAQISEGDRRLFYIPGCAMMTPELAARIDGAEAVFFDGTLWRDDEMVSAGLSAKTGRRMGHMSLSGPDGTLAAFQPIVVERKIMIHINNSNPVLLADSPERSLAVAAGWTVAEDGMRFEI
ncbi:pyrroloquinoline quinone biosynthesis protein PqqB [Sphingosinicellaceae bacterium]|nr:pyrroloquinoline quinone biosynthesis protein PqqB [Sphingosinicellaceae bacterium]